MEKCLTGGSATNCLWGRDRCQEKLLVTMSCRSQLLEKPQREAVKPFSPAVSLQHPLLTEPKIEPGVKGKVFIYLFKKKRAQAGERQRRG